LTQAASLQQKQLKAADYGSLVAMHLALKIIWSAALLLIIAIVGWFVLSPATNFLAGFGTETQIGMLFVFTVMPSILFLLISSGQMMKCWFVSTNARAITWTSLSVVYAAGLATAQYFLFIA